MFVLGIETSCDETSAAVVKDGIDILSCHTSSSLLWHKKYAGVIPEIASRKHLEVIDSVARSALESAKLTLDKIGLIAVTCSPGLLGSLLVGLSFARGLSLAKRIPLMEVNHLYAHIYACVLTDQKLKPPFISLVVSGGHTSLFLVKSFRNISLLGQTCDDACGEAFDKVAKLLQLGYPGGPEIEKKAREINHSLLKLKCSNTSRPLDFSFSGIKTAVLYITQNKLKKYSKGELAYSFQKTVVDALIEKSLLACRQKKIKTLAVGGGVAANSYLRDTFRRLAEKEKVKVFFPSKALCMDNAAMIAGLAYRIKKEGK
ncbi:MAG: tRNA (adenosine(37)-N6)-threonylcarbamoyltransferase complex transferase subunit TsaD [Candidatus Omnitrophica bacterium]|jgi:N6-L-threonylcarbamoyladenine synthase|nr:tRNA (adenosine(37)-N6)-threonylcarbamoyltransferase complex transferase subunit TsaD [Candidatus Omnitrophota bacterium]